MKRESFEFVDDPLRNVHLSGDSTVLQLCLRKDKAIAKRRVPDSAMMVVLSGLIRVDATGQNEFLGAIDAVILQPAEEHAVVALEDSVLLLILLSKATGRETATPVVE